MKLHIAACHKQLHIAAPATISSIAAPATINHAPPWHIILTPGTKV